MKKILIYSSSFSVAFLLGLYVFFPKEFFRAVVERSGVVEVENVHPAFLFGVKFEGVGLKLSKSEFELNEVVIKPSFISMLKLKPSANVFIKVDGGSCKVNIEGFDNMKLNISGEDLQAGEIIKGMEGTLDISANLRIPRESPISGEGDITIKGGGIVAVDVPLLPVAGKVKLGNIIMEITLKNRNLIIKKIKLTGGDIEGKISGSVKLSKDIYSSSLDLAVDISAKGFDIPKGIRIGGTLGSPRIL